MRKSRTAVLVSSVMRCIAALMLSVLGLLVVTNWANADSSGTTGQSGAANPNTFNLSAEADALQVVVSDPSLPVVTTVSASPYGASATLNSLGQSTSDAGAPYSPLVSSLPLTVSGLASGSLPNIPPLPGYVAASYPGSPTGSQTQAGYQLSAKTSADDAEGNVELGAEQPGENTANAFASAETTANSDGSVTVDGTAGFDALSIGGLLDLANVSTNESLTEQASQSPTITGTIKLGTITVLGLTTGILGDNLGILGFSTPVPLTTGVLPVLDALLSPNGVTLTYLPQTFEYTDGSSSTGATPTASKTVESVESGALEVSISKAVPSQGTVTTSFTLGRVYLSAADTPGFSPSTGDSGSPLSGEITGNSGIGGIASPTTSALGLLGVPPTSSSANPTASSTSGATPGPSKLPGSKSALSVGIIGPTENGLYLIVVASALALFLGSQLLRVLAVRRNVRQS
jgi:hypothetical protein